LAQTSNGRFYQHCRCYCGSSLLHLFLCKIPPALVGFAKSLNGSRHPFVQHDIIALLLHIIEVPLNLIEQSQPIIELHLYVGLYNLKANRSSPKALV
jgi:hypothetical protein